MQYHLSLNAAQCSMRSHGRTQALKTENVSLFPIPPKPEERGLLKVMPHYCFIPFIGELLARSILGIVLAGYTDARRKATLGPTLNWLSGFS
jgi:hypothetical protein